MTGTGLVSMVLISMGWLFFLGGLALHYQLLRRSLKAAPDEQVPSGMGFVPGVVGSITVFFTVGHLSDYGVEVPWPWLWIVLPLVVDPYCIPVFLLLVLRR